MGFGPSPGIAQALATRRCCTAPPAKRLELGKQTSSRFSIPQRVGLPNTYRSQTARPLALLTLWWSTTCCCSGRFRKNGTHHTITRTRRTQMDLALREPGVALDSLLRRYAEVGLSTKPSKVHDYAREQDLLGYRLITTGCGSRPAGTNLRDAAGVLRRRSWARPREVEALVGRFTHAFLLNRPALSVSPRCTLSRRKSATARLASGLRSLRSCNRARYPANGAR